MKERDWKTKGGEEKRKEKGKGETEERNRIRSDIFFKWANDSVNWGRVTDENQSTVIIDYIPFQ